jgi:transposase
LSPSDLTDAEWCILDPLLPDRGEPGPPISDKPRTVNGILWVLRTGAPRRDMPIRQLEFGLCALHTLEQAWRVGSRIRAWRVLGPPQLTFRCMYRGSETLD